MFCVFNSMICPFPHKEVLFHKQALLNEYENIEKEIEKHFTGESTVSEGYLSYLREQNETLREQIYDDDEGSSLYSNNFSFPILQDSLEIFLYQLHDMKFENQSVTSKDSRHGEAYQSRNFLRLNGWWDRSPENVLFFLLLLLLLF